MSDSAILVVETSLRGADADRHAESVAEWLLHSGVTLTDTDEHGGPTTRRMQPGAHVDAACPQWNDYPQVSYLDVDLHRERRVYDPGGNYQPPACLARNAVVGADEHISAVEEWLAGTEPLLSCTHCGQQHLVGDWRGEFGLHVAELAIEVYKWPPFDQEFLAELRRRLGPRSRIIFRRI